MKCQYCGKDVYIIDSESFEDYFCSMMCYLNYLEELKKYGD